MSCLTRSHVHAWFLAILLAGLLAGCAALLAPSGSTIELAATSTSISANSSTGLTATVLDTAGNTVQDGTRITFQSNIGVFNPPQARTRSGVATSQFTSSQVGTATISATSGAATSNAVTISVGQAVTVSLTATPTTATVNTAVTFTATVTPSGTTIDHYAWTFGDGATTTTTTSTTTHSYTTTGTMTVTVQAVTSGSSGPTAHVQITVQ